MDERKKTTTKKKPTNKKKIKKVNKKPIKKNKKVKFNIFKLARNVIILFVIFLVGHWIITSIFMPKQKKVAPPPKPVQKVVQPVAPKVTPAQEYNTKQSTLVDSIFRFNENLYMAMGGNNVVNLYPDSQNAITAMNTNLTQYSSKLNSEAVRADSLFLSELTLKNNAYINAVIAYNKEVLSKNPNKSLLKTLNQTVQDDYNAVNKFMNDNTQLFK